MPISGPSSYVSTVNEFLAHWAAANALLPVASPVQVISATGAVVTAVGFGYENTALLAARTSMVAKKNAVELARGDVEIGRELLLRVVNAFNERVRAVLPGSRYVRALPAIPTVTANEALFTGPLDDMVNLWATINALPAAGGFTPPLTLVINPPPAAAYTLALATAALDALRLAFRAVATERVGLKLALETRNDVQDRIYPILKAYRTTLPTYFVPGAAIVDSMPRLTPLPGSTPAAVTASAVWDAAAAEARVVWAASTAADLARYEVRGVAGPEYDADLEEVLGSFTPAQGRVFLTGFALTQAGASASFKVYVIVETGNEAGSEPMTVTRP